MCTHVLNYQNKYCFSTDGNVYLNGQIITSNYAILQGNYYFFNVDRWFYNQVLSDNQNLDQQIRPNTWSISYNGNFICAKTPNDGVTFENEKNLLLVTSSVSPVSIQVYTVAKNIATMTNWKLTNSMNNMTVISSFNFSYGIRLEVYENTIEPEVKKLVENRSYITDLMYATAESFAETTIRSASPSQVLGFVDNLEISNGVYYGELSETYNIFGMNGRIAFVHDEYMVSMFPSSEKLSDLHLFSENENFILHLMDNASVNRLDGLPITLGMSDAYGPLTKITTILTGVIKVVSVISEKFSYAGSEAGRTMEITAAISKVGTLQQNVILEEKNQDRSNHFYSNTLGSLLQINKMSTLKNKKILWSVNKNSFSNCIKLQSNNQSFTATYLEALLDGVKFDIGYNRVLVANDVPVGFKDIPENKTKSEVPRRLILRGLCLSSFAWDDKLKYTNIFYDGIQYPGYLTTNDCNVNTNNDNLMEGDEIELYDMKAFAGRGNISQYVSDFVLKDSYVRATFDATVYLGSADSELVRDVTIYIFLATDVEYVWDRRFQMIFSGSMSPMLGAYNLSTEIEFSNADKIFWMYQPLNKEGNVLMDGKYFTGAYTWIASDPSIQKKNKTIDIISLF